MSTNLGTTITIDKVYSHFRNRPYIFAMMILGAVFTNFVVSFDVNLYFFNSPFIFQSFSAPDIYLGISASSFTFGVIIFASLGEIIFDRHTLWIQSESSRKRRNRRFFTVS